MCLTGCPEVPAPIVAPSGVDESIVEAFSERLFDMLNNGAVSLSISLGHRTGLFDAMADLPPSSSQEIADAANLNERYVREWLGAMVTGRIVDFDAESRTYSLSPEHAACLTRSAAPNNIAAFCQYVGLLGTVEDDIVKCFHEGGGVPYAKFPRFQDVMAEDSGQSVVPAILDAILPLAPGIVEDLERGIDVLDIGCGIGRALNIMAAAFPNSRFYGYDISEEGTSKGAAIAKSKGLSNITFEARDVANLQEHNKFDLITAFDAIHDQAKPDVVLGEIAAALKPTGTFLMQDIAGSSQVEKNMDHPMGPFLYTISTMHCMTVSLAEGGAGLGTMWGEDTAQSMLKDAGFNNVSVHRLEHDVQNAYFVSRKG